MGFPFLMQHYLEYDEDGRKRRQPFAFDLTSDAGLDLAVRLLRWCGDNFPGLSASKGSKPEHVVSKLAGYTETGCSSLPCLVALHVRFASL